MNKPKANELGLETKVGALSPSPERLAREAASLNAMVAGLNKEAGVEAPKSAMQELKDMLPNIGATPSPTPRPLAKVLEDKRFKPAPIQHPRSPFNPRLLFFSGVLKSGKDHIAAAAGATIFSLASPLYRMREVFFGPQDKDKWGAREFLQWAGQVGRGVVNEKYLLNAGRANFVMMVRAMGVRGEFGFPDVSWADFGKSENLWLDAMLKRVVQYREQHGNEDKRCAVVNARFKNEVEALTAAGFTHFHVMVSPETWAARIKAAGLDPASPALRDTSEQLALNLNQQAMQASLKNPTRKLRVVWNDERQPAPSQAFHTLDSFLKDLELFS